MLQSIDPDAVLLRALADPTGPAIIRHLANDGQVCACDFAARMAWPSRPSRATPRVLREAGTVRGERWGTWTSSALQPGIAERLRALGDELIPAGPRSASALAGSMLRDRDSRNRPTELQ